MSQQTIDPTIMDEAKEIVGNKRLRPKDILVLSGEEIAPRGHENVFFLPKRRIYISVTAATPKAPLQAPKYHRRTS